MTEEPKEADNLPQEPTTVLKVPEGYKPTTTEMIIRGAGFQAENRDDSIQT